MSAQRYRLTLKDIDYQPSRPLRSEDLDGIINELKFMWPLVGITLEIIEEDN